MIMHKKPDVAFRSARRAETPPQPGSTELTEVRPLSRGGIGIYTSFVV
jgi:hypothetical protein